MVIFFERKLSEKWKKTLLLMLLISVSVVATGNSSVITYAENGLSMYSGSYALMDGDTGRLLTGENETNPMANASTTKILTCIVTLENSSLDELVTISSNAAAQPRVRLGMEEGEQYPLKDMLYGLMLESYNDCAVAIAEHVAGSVEAFSDMMNEKAKKIGCVDTCFLTPNGLDKEVENQFHHTTAEDLCRIMAYCVWESPQKEMFLEITQTRNYSGSFGGNNYSFVNRNAFLDQMDGVLSGKTGYTSKAGYCYVAALERDDERYCIALLACGWPNNKTYKWKDATKLFNYGIDNYDLVGMSAESILEEIVVQGYVGKSNFSNLNQEMTLRVTGQCEPCEILMKEGEELEKEIILYTDEELPIEEGQIMGVCNYYIEDILLQSVPLVAQTSGGSWEMEDVIHKIFLQFLTFSSQSGL